MGLVFVPLIKSNTVGVNRLVGGQIDYIVFFLQRMNKKGDHRPRNSDQYERVVDLLIMHKAKWTLRQIPLLPSVLPPRSIIRQLRKDFRSCLMIDLGRETDGNNGICLSVHFALRIVFFLGCCGGGGGGGIYDGDMRNTQSSGILAIAHRMDCCLLLHISPGRKIVLGLRRKRTSVPPSTKASTTIQTGCKSCPFRGPGTQRQILFRRDPFSHYSSDLHMAPQKNGNSIDVHTLDKPYTSRMTATIRTDHTSLKELDRSKSCRCIPCLPMPTLNSKPVFRSHSA